MTMLLTNDKNKELLSMGYQISPYFLLIIGIIPCLLPIILDWELQGSSWNEVGNISSTFKSNQVQCALIARTTSGVPMAADLILDVLYLLILLLAVPLGSPKLLICLFNFRNMINANCLIRMMSESGIGIFGLKEELLINTCFTFTFACCSYISFTTSQTDSLDVKDSCTQSVVILNELLSFDKIEAGMLALDRIQVNAWDIISWSLNRCYNEAHKAKVQIIAPVAQSATADILRKTLLNIDQDKILQCLQCLISNALERTPQGKTITITAYIIENVVVNTYNYRTDPQSLLRLSIKDSGFGLSPEMLSMFSYNFTKNGDNSGLTLEDIKVIFEIHSGSLSIETESTQEGCTITIDLPAKSTANNRQVQPQSQDNMTVSRMDTSEYNAMVDGNDIDSIENTTTGGVIDTPVPTPIMTPSNIIFGDGKSAKQKKSKATFVF
eukprot:gene2377-4613_t